MGGAAQRQAVGRRSFAYPITCGGMKTTITHLSACPCFRRVLRSTVQFHCPLSYWRLRMSTIQATHTTTLPLWSACISSMLLLLATIFYWELVDLLTVFLAPLLALTLWAG